MTIRKALLFILFFSPLYLLAQNYTISGYVTDLSSGETLISASIFEKNAGKGTVSNVYGFYSISLRAGEVKMLYSYVGYEQENIEFHLSKDTVINITLKEQGLLKELVVIGHQRETGVRGAQISAVEVPITQIKTVPALFGETDVIKALQLLPGVQGGTEGAAGFYVRGGGPDENLFLLDGVPVYNVNHLGGFFSVFNSDAIKNVTLYKGGFPARFGSRLSSVLDIRMKDGNNKKIKGDFSIGLISSKINLEGPILSENTTFNLSARRTYLDILAMPLIKMASSAADVKGNGGYFFYDLNAKLSHKFSDKDRLYLSFYMGDDKVHAKVSQKPEKEHDQEGNEYVAYESGMKMKMNWGNQIAALRWNHVINNKLFMNLTSTYTRYRFDVGVTNFATWKDFETKKPKEEKGSLSHFSGIYDFSGKLNFDYMLNSNNNIKFGLDYINHSFRPGVTTAKVTGDILIDKKIGDVKKVDAHETALYVEDNIKIGSWVNANVGLHYSTFYVQKKFYHSLQPRLSGSFLLTDDLSIKTGYAYMSQYIHLLSNSNLSLPTDLWVPATKRIQPMNSHQVSLGVFYNLLNFVDLSVEGYYKEMQNVLEYKDGASFMGTSTAGWEDKVNMGRGRAYGVELLAQKTVGETTGWVGYTWSKAERIFDRPGEMINFGKPFPAKYDRRHDISIVVSHKLNKNIELSATWIYSTGNAGTLSLQSYPSSEYQENKEELNVPYSYYHDSEGLPYISHRNNFRYPDYHRLDLGVNFHKQKKRGMRTWNISVYNAYNNMNPFIILESDPFSDKKKLKKVTIFPIIPSVSYSYKF